MNGHDGSRNISLAPLKPDTAAVSTKKISIIDPADIEPVFLRNGKIESRRLVTLRKDGSERMSFHVNCLQAGNRSIDVAYPEMDEINYMVKGKAMVAFNGERHEVREGMVWNIPAGCRYDFWNDEDVVLVSVFSPPRE